jgi:signal transduction histidine kinase
MYKRNNDLLLSVLDNIENISLLIDYNGCILYLNHQLAQVFNINNLENRLLNCPIDNLFVEMNAQLAKNDKPFTFNNKNDFEDEILLNNKYKYSRKYNRIFDAELNEFKLWSFKFIKQINLDFDESMINSLNTDILNIIPADIALFNLNHQYLFVNNVGVRSNSMKEWIIGKNDFDYCEYTGKSINIAETRRYYFNEAVKSGNQIDFEEESILTDGTSQTHLRIFLPIKNSLGAVTLVAGYGINISTTKLIERQNELFINNIEKFFDNSSSIIISVDLDGIIRYVNPAFQDFYQMPKNEICNSKNLSYFFFTESDKTIGDEHQIFKTLSPKGITHQFKVQIIESIISQNNGLNKYYFLTDITDDIVVKNNLHQQIIHDRKLNLQKSNFISMVSHELRTPLSIILSNVEILQIIINNKQHQQIDFQKNFDKIYFQINKMIEMIGKYLFLNKLETLLYKPDQEKIILKQFFSEIVNNEYMPWIDGRKLEYTFKSNRKCKNAEIIDGNKDNLKVVISNLIENAFKYSANSKKSPILRVSIKEQYYSILIIDFGIGIIKSEYSLIFKPFARGSNVDNIRGTGFGLMYVNQFVEFASGKILIRSTKDKYTIINLQIPFLNVN